MWSSRKCPLRWPRLVGEAGPGLSGPGP
jgi:hypothetical protein